MKDDLAAELSVTIGQSVASVRPLDTYAQNLNFIVSVDGTDYFLKLYSDGSSGEREFEQKVLSKLQSEPSTQFVPIVCKPGVFTVRGRPAMLFNLVKGRTLNTADITDDMLARIARQQAAMHTVMHGTNYGTKERFSPLNLDFVDYFKLAANDDLTRNCLKRLRAVEEIDSSRLLTTLIHDDLSPANVMVDADGCLHFIDFDDAHYSFRISDVGTAIKEFILPTWGADQAKINAYIQTYDNNLPEHLRLTPQEVSILPLMILRRALFMFAYYSSQKPTPEVNLHIAKERDSMQFNESM